MVNFYDKKRFLESASTWIEGERLNEEQRKALMNGFSWFSDPKYSKHSWSGLHEGKIVVDSNHIHFLEQHGVFIKSVKIEDYL